MPSKEERYPESLGNFKINESVCAVETATIKKQEIKNIDRMCNNYFCEVILICGFKFCAGWVSSVIVAAIIFLLIKKES